VLTRSSDVVRGRWFSGVKRKVGTAAKVRRARQREAPLPRGGYWAAALQEPGAESAHQSACPGREEDAGRQSKLFGLGVYFRNCA